MRSIAAATYLLGLLCLPAAAQQVPLCGSDVPILGPPAAVPTHSVPSFRWSAEPGGTAWRELVITSTTDPALSRLGRVEAFGAQVRLEKGSYVWFVSFRDARGRLICRTELASIVVGVRRANTMASLAESSSAPTIYIDANGRYVIVLQDSRYTGPYTERIASDNFDARNYALGPAIGLVIHGNDRRNEVWGSSGSDVIILYDGNDEAYGGAGDDEMHGGRGNDHLWDSLDGNDVDVLYGGPDNDRLYVNDGDDDDTAHLGGGFNNATVDGVGSNDNSTSGSPEGIVDP